MGAGHRHHNERAHCTVARMYVWHLGLQVTSLVLYWFLLALENLHKSEGHRSRTLLTPGERRKWSPPFSLLSSLFTASYFVELKTILYIP